MGKGKKKEVKVDQKKVQKIVEDKTFGLKNKNKSKKVQQYIKQVQANAQGGKSAEWHAAQAAKKKAEKEAQKQAEKEMLALLGESFSLDKKQKKKKEKAAKAETAEEIERRRREEHERDFGVPITSLDEIYRTDSKAIVIRACAVLESKDALAKKTAKNEECLIVKISDGTTRKPMSMTLIGWNPTTFMPKVGVVLDIRDAVAMVRGEKVELEVTKGIGSVTEASPSLTEYVTQAKDEQEELREKGGLPIEELIEEQRAALNPSELTPVTKERFLEWKEKKRKKKEAEWEEKRLAAAKKTGGKGLNVLSGKALFAFDPSLFKDDDEAIGTDDVDTQQDEEHESHDEKISVDKQNNSAKDSKKGQSKSDKMEVSVDGVAVDLQESLYLDDDGDVDLDDLED